MDLRKLKTLIDLVSESNVSELEITEAEGKVRIVKAGLAAPAVAAVPVQAVPVAAPEAVMALEPLCDELVALVQPHILGAVGRFYEDFTQTEDDEVIRLLAETDCRQVCGDCPTAKTSAKSGRG